jgi:gamma-glutamyltranspeptidase/glutathione hydrolase
MTWFRPIAVLELFAAALFACAAAPLPSQPPTAPLRFDNGAVASDSAIASEVGASVLRRGGSAVDAAVATAFALAVVHPAAGNIGGGGFLLVLPADGRVTSFDFRERAPAAARADMFLDAKGEYDPARHHASHLAVGVPGTVAGLWLAHQRLGELPWKDLVEPAVRLAADGFPLSRALAASLEAMLPQFRRYPASLAQFSKDGAPCRAGDLFRQPDLARTLARIRDHGPDGFYRGETAELFATEMARGGGILTLDDLASYRAVERPPVRGSFAGYEVISMGPPSSGGVALVEMLHVLEGYDLRALGLRSAAEVHLLTEAMRRAFADRARYLGDPDFVDAPIARLVSTEHAAALRKGIDPRRASKSSPERFEWPAEGGETTHVSVVDKDRMAVALTTTLEESFGSRIVVPGAGFLLNNEMGDFNPAPGLTTEDGRIGTEPNLAAPGKRPLSSMAPAIVARGGKPVLVLGSPGGRTIINTVLEVVVNHLAHGLPVQEAVDAPRFHHQWLPDRILVEPRGFSPDTRRLLEAMGHRVEERKDAQGSAMAIAVREDGTLEAGVDRRRADTGAAGH